MKRSFALLVSLLLPLTVLGAPPAETKPTDPGDKPAAEKKEEDKIDWSKVPTEKVLGLIKRFEEDPLKAKTEGIAGLLMDFAGQSEDVLVEANVAYLPNLARKGKQDDALLAAFIIGNVRPQIVGKNKKQDHPLEGLKMLLAVYSRLLKDKQLDNIPEYDAWVKLDDKGLADLVAKQKKGNQKDEEKKAE
jgi:hypothetical protein